MESFISSFKNMFCKKYQSIKNFVARRAFQQRNNCPKQLGFAIGKMQVCSGNILSIGKKTNYISFICGYRLLF